MSEDIEETQVADTEEEHTSEKQQEPDVKTLLAQKTHWREKAKKLEEENAALKKAAPEKPEEPKDDDGEWKRRIEFTVSHKEYDSDDIRHLLTIAKGAGVALEKAAEDPLFQSYYSAKQEEKKAAMATPQTTRSPRATPPKPIEEMTREEHEAYFRKITGT